MFNAEFLTQIMTNIAPTLKSLGYDLAFLAVILVVIRIFGPLYSNKWNSNVLKIYPWTRMAVQFRENLIREMQCKDIRVWHARRRALTMKGEFAGYPFTVEIDAEIYGRQSSLKTPIPSRKGFTVLLTVELQTKNYGLRSSLFPTEISELTWAEGKTLKRLIHLSDPSTQEFRSNLQELTSIAMQEDRSAA